MESMTWGEGAPNERKTDRNKIEIPLSERLAAIREWLGEHKARDVVALDLREQTAGAFADCLLVGTATSQRHARSLADGLAEFCHERGFEYLRMEGYAVGEWILVDLNDMIVNIFLESTRELYRLEELWGHVATRSARENRRMEGKEIRS